MDKKQVKLVKSHDVRIDEEYAKWLSEVKDRYHSAQIKSAVIIHREQLSFNWQLGRDLVLRRAEEKWGAGVVEQISLDLRAAFPFSKGFSPSNLWRMKQWYLFYSRYPDIAKLAQVGREMPEDTFSSGIPFPDYFSFVPWKHHIAIITKCKTIEEALFYISKTVSESWSRKVLEDSIKADLYHTLGKGVTNFDEILGMPNRSLAQSITKEIYDFGFLSLSPGYNEEALETELEKQLTRFLLELGTGFAYLGRQKQIIVGGKTRKIDMLFFHIPLNCYIVVELKTVSFRPEFAGKLNYYVNIVDDIIKTPKQNPTIGLLICSDKDNTEVQYAIKGVKTPIGVAAYDNVKIKEIQAQLPSVEDLKNRLRF